MDVAVRQAIGTSMFIGVLLLWTGLGVAAVTAAATVEELTSMATNQAMATWKPVEVSNSPYVVTVKPISKMLGNGCALLHHVIRKHGKIVRDHTLTVCEVKQ
jgi:hypothetical protein